MAVALLWTCAWLQPTPTAIIQLISIFGSRPCSLEGLALSLSLYLYPCLFPSVLPGIDQQTSHLYLSASAWVKMKLVCSTVSCGAHCCALLKRCHAKNVFPAQQTGLPSTVDVCLISGQGHGARHRNFCVLRKGPHRRACNLFGQQNAFWRWQLSCM